MNGRQRAPGHDLDERALRGVRRRLTVLITGLLCALLLVLGASVYVTMHEALLQPARQAIQARAVAQTDHLLELERGGAERSEVPDEQERGGVFIGYATAGLQYLGGTTPFGRSLPDPAAARRALASRQPSYTTRSTGGETYLIYSRPVLDRGRLAGVEQTGISEGQYEGGIHALLLVLFAVGGFGVLASAGIAAVVVRRALLPIRMSMQRQRDFVADAAHELRTPLTIMRTAAELGLTSEDPEDQQVALEQMLAQGSHLTHLVDDLSLLARADSGAVTLDRRPLDLADLTADTLSGLELLAEERGVRLTVDLADDVPVIGDDGRLRQVLMILLDNAFKHTPEGGSVLVRVTREGDRVALIVHDSGPGIDPRHLPHVFDRFYQADGSSGESNGTGLGLAIARWIAEAHGGHIAAANAPEGGAVFTVTLPPAGRHVAGRLPTHVG